MRWWRSHATTDARAKLRCRTALGGMLGFGLTSAVAWVATGGYARPELLAETAWLAQQLNDPGVRIVDMRTEEAYRKGHLPGAVHLERKALKDADNEVYVIPPDKLGALMSALGIGKDTTVVGYDDQGGLGPARLWWVLDYYGHTKAKVLNGGWNKWVKEKRPVTADVPAPQAAPFDLKVDPQQNLFSR